jgi:hypothetical protein
MFGVWSHMLSRCTFPDDRAWSSYGGRGIAVCARWHDFANFLADMGCPPLGLSLDRIDNDGPYAPDNCRWADRFTQARNTRRNRFVTLGGVRMCHAQAARSLGISEATAMRWANAGRLGDPE